MDWVLSEKGGNSIPIHVTERVCNGHPGFLKNKKADNLALELDCIDDFVDLEIKRNDPPGKPVVLSSPGTSVTMALI